MSETERCSWCGAEAIETAEPYVYFPCRSFFNCKTRLWFRHPNCRPAKLQPAFNGVEFELIIPGMEQRIESGLHLPRRGDVVQWQEQRYRVIEVTHELTDEPNTLLIPRVVVCPIDEEKGSE